MRTAAAIFAALLAVSVHAAPGHWYEPDRSGYGLQINQDTGFGSAVTLYLYRRDGSTAFLIGGDNCEAFPCALTLHEPIARFMGGDLDIGDPVGELEIGQYDGDTLPIRYDLRLWLGEYCEDITPGGVIFRECAGRRELQLLTP